MKENKTIPYIAYEASLAREERHIKRLIIALSITIVLLFASNAMWLYVYSQYDYGDTSTTTTIATASQDGTGTNIVGGGDIDYGAESDNSQDDHENKNTH